MREAGHRGPRRRMMKAAVYTGREAIELRDWPEPAAGPGEVVLRVRGCGLCGSDIAKFSGGTAHAPAVFGHEVVGEVVSVGPGVVRFVPGQRVVAAHHVPCFHCHYCRDRKSTRLNSSHVAISYAVFCLKKK